MNKGETNIIEIINGCRDNNRADQKMLYKTYYSFALSICNRYASSREEAVEIMNDGFYKVFRYIRSFSLDQPFEPWLKRIMVNSSIDHFRKKSKLLQEESLLAAEHAVTESTILDSISYDEMLNLVRQLPDAYRTVFNLIAIEGYKHEEVAEMLNISAGTSKSNYSRARKKLQHLLTGYFGVSNG